MSGRGDNNKAGSSGRGASNQSNQGFGPDAPKSNHGLKTGGKPSTPDRKEEDSSSDRSAPKQKGRP